MEEAEEERPVTRRNVLESEMQTEKKKINEGTLTPILLKEASYEKENLNMNEEKFVIEEKSICKLDKKSSAEHFKSSPVQELSASQKKTTITKRENHHEAILRRDMEKRDAMTDIQVNNCQWQVYLEGENWHRTNRPYLDFFPVTKLETEPEFKKKQVIRVTSDNTFNATINEKTVEIGLGTEVFSTHSVMTLEQAKTLRWDFPEIQKPSRPLPSFSRTRDLLDNMDCNNRNKPPECTLGRGGKQEQTGLENCNHKDPKPTNKPQDDDWWEFAEGILRENTKYESIIQEMKRKGNEQQQIIEEMDSKIRRLEKQLIEGIGDERQQATCPNESYINRLEERLRRCALEKKSIEEKKQKEIDILRKKIAENDQIEGKNEEREQESEKNELQKLQNSYERDAIEAQKNRLERQLEKCHQERKKQEMEIDRLKNKIYEQDFNNLNKEKQMQQLKIRIRELEDDINIKDSIIRLQHNKLEGKETKTRKLKDELDALQDDLIYCNQILKNQFNDFFILLEAAVDNNPLSRSQLLDIINAHELEKYFAPFIDDSSWAYSTYDYQSQISPRENSFLESSEKESPFTSEKHIASFIDDSSWSYSTYDYQSQVSPKENSFLESSEKESPFTSEKHIASFIDDSSWSYSTYDYQSQVSPKENSFLESSEKESPFTSEKHIASFIDDSSWSYSTYDYQSQVSPKENSFLESSEKESPFTSEKHIASFIDDSSWSYSTYDYQSQVSPKENSFLESSEKESPFTSEKHIASFIDDSSWSYSTYDYQSQVSPKENSFLESSEKESPFTSEKHIASFIDDSSWSYSTYDYQSQVSPKENSFLESSEKESPFTSEKHIASFIDDSSWSYSTYDYQSQVSPKENSFLESSEKESPFTSEKHIASFIDDSSWSYSTYDYQSQVSPRDNSFLESSEKKSPFTSEKGPCTSTRSFPQHLNRSINTDEEFETIELSGYVSVDWGLDDEEDVHKSDKLVNTWGLTTSHVPESETTETWETETTVWDTTHDLESQYSYTSGESYSTDESTWDQFFDTNWTFERGTTSDIYYEMTSTMFTYK
ncbi:uncharacterized protein [Palaemon carinicauda]|uniref:uncharacterized protein n=1 Tax=Palaemon carinicauda TaxID=392227 RepID=UPI0035B623C7